MVTKISFLYRLLAPSLLSGWTVILLAVSVLSYNGWIYASHNQFFYNYLFGPYGLYTYIWQNTLSVTEWYQTFLGSPIAYYIIVGAAALCASLVVFTVLRIANLLIRGTETLWHEALAEGVTHREAAIEMLWRLGLRLLSIIGWALYLVFFVSFLLGVAIFSNQIGLQYISEGDLLGVVFCLGALLFFCLTLHMHVLFARLAFLRLRVFGGVIV